MIGRIVSTKMTKTVIVLVERIAKHPLYKKTYSRSKRYLVDDPIGVKMGDLVEIAKVKPISRSKHWRIVKVVGKNLEEITEEKLKAAAEKVIAEVIPESPEKSEDQNDSENQKVRKSDNRILRSTDMPSSSEASEKKIKKNERRSKK